MLKNILNLEGAQKLSNVEQKSINGGVTKACAEFMAAYMCRIKGTTSCGGIYPTPTTDASCGALLLCCA